MYYLADVAIILAVALALVLASWWSADPERTLLENTALGAGALLGLAALLLALQGHSIGVGFHLWPLLLWLLFPFHIPLREKPSVFKQQATACWRGLRGLRSVEPLLALFLVLICALALFLSLAPPNANDYDSLVYHLAAPQQYLREGRIVELPYDHHSYFPFGLEMLYMLGLELSGPVLAKLFHWLMLPLCCLTIIAMGHGHLSLRAGLSGAALFATIPIVLIEATTAYIDLGLTAFVLLAFLCFANWLQTRELHWLAWSGAMAGFACNTKYFGVLFFGWLLLWALGDMVQRRQFRLAPLVWFCVLTAVLGGFYYIRNLLWVGNPVFPFAYEIFGGRGWTAEMAEAYSRDQAVYGYGRGILDWVLLPWRLAMTPFNFIYSQPFWPLPSVPSEAAPFVGRFEVGGHVLQTIVGPALLAFGAPLVFFRRKPQVVGFLLWSFLFFWVFWAATSQQLRYLLPSFALLCLPCGWGIVRMYGRGAILQTTVTAALVAWLLFVPVLTAWRLRDAAAVAMGTVEPQTYLTRSFPGYEAMQWASNESNIPPGAVFAVYGEPRCFYLKRKYFWADDAHHTLIDYSQITNAEQLIAALKELGADHILWNSIPEKNGGFGMAPPHINEAMEAGLVTELFSARGYRVFRIE